MSRAGLDMTSSASAFGRRIAYILHILSGRGGERGRTIETWLVFFGKNEKVVM
jgi:hypothetical protein